jgi:hypothetical protein
MGKGESDIQHPLRAEESLENRAESTRVPAVRRIPKLELSERRAAEGQGSRIPDTAPRPRSAEPGFAPASTIERAAQHLDWTIAFGMRHSTPRGLEGAANQQPESGQPRVAPAPRLRFGQAGRPPIPLISRLFLASVLVAAAAGAGIFLLTHSAGEKATAENALATEVPTKASKPTSLIRGLAALPPAARTAQSATLSEPSPPATAPDWEAQVSLGPPPSPPGGPQSKVATTPAAKTPATSTFESPAPRNQPTVPAFSAAEIARLLSRGDWLSSTGDVASARLLYERAADAGVARAAVRLGETFDPSYLDSSHLRGLHGDPGTAVFWYRRARDLGDTGVASRLERLETKEGRN